MGVYYCSTGKHTIFISVPPMQSFVCDCPTFSYENIETWEVPDGKVKREARRQASTGSQEADDPKGKV